MTTIDLNIRGGFALTADENMDDDALYELIRKIESEANAALGMVAYKYNLGFTGAEIQTEE